MVTSLILSNILFIGITLFLLKEWSAELAARTQLQEQYQKLLEEYKKEQQARAKAEGWL